ncbi:MAG: hypothetical protein EOR22_06430 [Mesorhizobium sp.]|nr:MAG: hypothetical protein EOR22_06430 [Mesorhizobium sp.]
MAEITTTYRGHEIRYGDNTDEWYCGDLESGNNSHVSLAKLKAKIDKMYLDLRKQGAVKAFEIQGYGGDIPRLAEATIVEYLGQGKTYNSRTNHGSGGYVAGPHKIAVVATRRGNERASRAEQTFDDIMPDTPEAHAAFAEAVRLAQLARAAQAAATAALKAVPRLSLDDIRELVRIKESETA